MFKNIEPITNPQELKKIDFLLREYKFKPYYFLKRIKSADLFDYFSSSLSKVALNKDNIFLVIKDQNEAVGFLLLEKQAWDTSFFGFNCYKIEYIFALGDKKTQFDRKNNLLESAIHACEEKSIHYLSIKADSQDNASIHVLESCGFSLVATMLQFVCPVGKIRGRPKQIGKIRPYEPKDLGILRNIAKNSMRYDHFHSDPNFSKIQSDGIYEALIENCCNGKVADKVFVVERKNKIVGYVCCQIKKQTNEAFPLRIGHIRHLATLYPEGFGCGPGLQDAALNWFRDKVDIVESATTIQNLPIIRISLSSNMQIAASYLRFSKWFKI